LSEFVVRKYAQIYDAKYRVIHNSLRDFRTRQCNNQDRHRYRYQITVLFASSCRQLKESANVLPRISFYNVLFHITELSLRMEFLVKEEKYKEKSLLGEGSVLEIL
jgi:hypothetical protein